MFWDYRDVLRTTFHAMNFQNNFQILAQVVGQSPIPRYGYQAVWEVKRVKHLTRCVALHRTIHRAKLAKLETFVSFVPQLAQLLSCSSCCWAWWSLAEVAWTSVEESLWTHHTFFLLREGDRLWQQTVVSFIITRILHRSERIKNSKLPHIISNKTLLQQKQRYGFKGPLVWAPAKLFFRSGHESWTDSVQFLRLKPTDGRQCGQSMNLGGSFRMLYGIWLYEHDGTYITFVQIYLHSLGKHTFMSTYQVDSFFHSFMTQLVTQRRQKSRVGTSPSTSSTRSRASTYRWDQGARCPIFRCLTSFADFTHFWWTNSNTEYIFVWWNIYLKHHIGFGTSFLHSVCGIAFRITLSISWLPKLSFSKGWLLWIQHKSPRGLLAFFFLKCHADTYCVLFAVYANRKYHDFGIQLAHLITKR